MMCICQISERELWTWSWCVPDHTAMFEACSAVGLGISWPVQTTSSMERTYQNTCPAMDCRLKRSSEVLYNLEMPISCVQLLVFDSATHRKTGTWNGGQGNGTPREKQNLACHALALCQSKWQWATVVLAIVPLVNFQLTTRYLTPPANTVHIALFRAAILA